MSTDLQRSDLDKREVDNLLQELYEDSYLLNQHFGESGSMSSLSLIRTLASPILRKWICDRNFSKIQRAMEKNVQFDVYHSQKAIKLCKAGMARTWIEMMPAFGLFIGSFRPSNKNPKYKHSFEPLLTPFDYKALCIQKLVFHKGKFHKREEFVRLMANKLGGTHPKTMDFGKHRDLFEASNQMGFALKKGSVQIVSQHELSNKSEYERKHQCVLYDLSFLITIDTAKVFSKGVLRDVFGISS